MAWAGNPSDEFDLLLVHADQLARADDLQEKLRLSHRDLVIVDEAHKASGSCFGNNVKRDQVLSARRAAVLDCGRDAVEAAARHARAAAVANAGLLDGFREGQVPR